MGVTDKYWLAALIPDQAKPFKAIYTYDNGYIAYYRSLNAQSVQSNGEFEVSSKIFIGAKEAKLIDQYQEDYNIYNFDLAIDWGWFYFLTKPLFYIIYYFSGISGNFGLAIIILTVITRIIFFPLASGKLDGFWEKDLNLWDVSTGILLVKEAGGKISKIDGNAWEINSRDLVASNNKIHNELVKKLTLL